MKIIIESPSSRAVVDWYSLPISISCLITAEPVKGGNRLWNYREIKPT